MATFAPPAIRACYETVRTRVPVAQFGGIADPSRVTAFGYHNSRNNHLRHRPNDYSIQRPDDRTGNGWAGSALDITLPPREMALLTQRLIDATLRRDPRMHCVREFFGTVNGTTVTGLDVRDRRWVTADRTHLWHIHISFYRRFATNHAAMQGVAGVIIGTPGKDEDVNRKETETMIANAIRAYHFGGNRGVWTRKKYPGWIRAKDRGINWRILQQERRK